MPEPKQYAELEKACFLYLSGLISGGELSVAMAEAGLPEKLIDLVLELHGDVVGSIMEKRDV